MALWTLSFDQDSLHIFELQRTGAIRLVISDVFLEELIVAPPMISEPSLILTDSCELVSTTPEAEHLQTAYLAPGVLPEKCRIAALHLALATVNGCMMIVSWNFKHIVNASRIPLFNAVKATCGYKSIEIYTPVELKAYV